MWIVADNTLTTFYWKMNILFTEVILIVTGKTKHTASFREFDVCR